MRNVMIGGGARIQGRATVTNRELVLTADENGSGSGRFFVPSLPLAEQGWTCTFRIRLSARGNPADGFALVYGNTQIFPAEPLVVQTYNFNSPNIRMAVWRFGTFARSMPGVWWWSSNSPGLSVGNYYELLRPGTGVNANITIAWNPQSGMYLRAVGLATTPLTFSHAFEQHRGAAAAGHGWMLIGETGGLTEAAVIDDFAIDAPCKDCRDQGGTCTWPSANAFQCVLPATTSRATTATRTTATTTATTTTAAPTTMPTLMRCQQQSDDGAAACVRSLQECEDIGGEMVSDSLCKTTCCRLTACTWSNWSPCECSPSASTQSKRERTATVAPTNWPMLPPCEAMEEDRECCPLTLTLPTTSTLAVTAGETNETAAVNEPATLPVSEPPGLAPWAIGTIVVVVGLLCLVVVVVAVVCFKRKQQAAAAATELGTPRTQQYGTLPQASSSSSEAYGASSQFASLR